MIPANDDKPWSFSSRAWARRRARLEDLVLQATGLAVSLMFLVVLIASLTEFWNRG